MIRWLVWEKRMKRKAGSKWVHVRYKFLADVHADNRDAVVAEVAQRWPTHKMADMLIQSEVSYLIDRQSTVDAVRCTTCGKRWGEEEQHCTVCERPRHIDFVEVAQ